MAAEIRTRIKCPPRRHSLRFFRSLSQINRQNNSPLRTPIRRRQFHNCNAVCWPIRLINWRVHASSTPSFNQTRKNWDRSHISQIHIDLLTKGGKNGNTSRSDASPARPLRPLNRKYIPSPHVIITPIILTRHGDCGAQTVDCNFRDGGIGLPSDSTAKHDDVFNAALSRYDFLGLDTFFMSYRESHSSWKPL